MTVIKLVASLVSVLYFKRQLFLTICVGMDLNIDSMFLVEINCINENVLALASKAV